MPVCSIVKTITPRAVDDLMHYCTRPKSECNSASGCPWYEVIVGLFTNMHEITIITQPI